MSGSRAQPTALVTGASRGLGRLVAARLVADGWHVFATMRDPAARTSLDEAVASLGADASSLTVLSLDVRSPDSIAAATAAVFLRTGGRLDALIACAGILIAGPFEETPLEAMRRVLEVNFFGTTETVRAALPGLRRARGRIILVSSDSGFCGTAGLSGYTASKFALEGWGESVADELAPLGVRLSLIEPGPFASDIFSAAEIHRGDESSAYAPLASVSESALRSLDEDAPSAAPVVKAVMQALTARNPRLRYRVGREARLLSASRSLLPERAFRHIARRLTGTQSWSKPA